MINSLKEHFNLEYPKEACGVLVIHKGKEKWIPITNIADSKDDFVMAPKEYLAVLRKYDIKAIVHNHINTSNAPSEKDIISCNALGIPYYIYSYPSMDLNILLPDNYRPLCGREYMFGIDDCFEAAKAYYSTIGINIPTRGNWKDNWWDLGEDYFSDENIRSWNFSRVEQLKVNDLLIFNTGSSVADHCGVYLGNDVFYHHAHNRLSCRENLYPMWKKFLIRTYRYET